MFKVIVTLPDFVVPEADIPTKILSFVGALQSAGKTDGEVTRTNVGSNLVIERVFTDQLSAKMYEDFIQMAYTPGNHRVETIEI